MGKVSLNFIETNQSSRNSIYVLIMVDFGNFIFSYFFKVTRLIGWRSRT